jgi:hypothetical protein
MSPMLVALVVLTVLSPAPLTVADPTPAPGPYQIITPAGSTIGGLRTLPPICAVQPRSCAMTWDPSTRAWNTSPGTGSP